MREEKSMTTNEKLETIETAIQLLTAQILNLRTELLAIKELTEIETALKLTEDEKAETRFIKVELPCGVTDCGNTARIASAEKDPRYPGHWLIFPRCKQCTEGLMKTYEESEFRYDIKNEG